MPTAALGEQLDRVGLKNDEFEKTANEAMQIAGVLKESDLSDYIPYGDGSLSKDVFYRMKELNKKELAELIRENIIEKEPKKYSSDYLTNDETSLKKASLKEVIKRASQKVGATKSSGICFYVPLWDRVNTLAFRQTLQYYA